MVHRGNNDNNVVPLDAFLVDRLCGIEPIQNMCKRNIFLKVK